MFIFTGKQIHPQKNETRTAGKIDQYRFVKICFASVKVRRVMFLCVLFRGY